MLTRRRDALNECPICNRLYLQLILHMNWNNDIILLEIIRV